VVGRERGAGAAQDVCIKGLLGLSGVEVDLEGISVREAGDPEEFASGEGAESFCVAKAGAGFDADDGSGVNVSGNGDGLMAWYELR
jgi:hypothetical protein